MTYKKNFVARMMTLATVFAVLIGSAIGQDLQKQKQDKLKRVSAIDRELSSVSKDEYDQLIEERKKLAADIKAIDQKLLSDVNAMKKINAVKKAYNDGNTARKLGQYENAIKHYDHAIEMDSTFFRAYYGKGLTLKTLRRYPQAVAAYAGCVRHNPSYTDAYVNMGRIQRTSLSQVDKAISTFKTAIEYNPSAHKALYELGVSYLSYKKDYKKAAESFTKATLIKPDYDLAFFSLGVSLTELSQLDQAVANLENALAFTSRKKWASPHARLAVVYNKKGKCAKALEEAALALTMKKKNGLANYEAGKAAKCKGQLQKALAYFEALKKDRRWKRTAEYEIDLIVNRDKYGGSN